MSYEFGYEVSDRLVRRIARRLFLFRLDLRMALLVGSYLLLLVLLTLIASPLVAGIFWGTALLLFVLVPVAYFIRAQQSTRLLAKLPHRHVRWEVRDDALVRHSPLGDATLPWRLFDTVATGPDVWLFLVQRSLAAAIPTDQLQPQVANFILARLLDAGVRVKGAQRPN